jgi:hypothetical protein
VTPVILLILAVLWIAVLAPGFIKKRAERRSVDSIDSFHHQLHLLEQQSGPKLVAPAYRLDTAPATGTAGLPAITSMPGRPKLVLLGRSADGGEMDYGASYDDWAQVDGSAAASGVAALDDPVEKDDMSTLRAVGIPGSAGMARRRPDIYERKQALKRRRDVFAGLVGTFVLTALLGMVDSLRLLWVVTIISGLALVGYVLLMGYARQQVVQRRAAQRVRSAGSPPVRPAVAGANSLRRLSGAEARSRDELARYRAATRVDDTAQVRAYVPQRAAAR